MNNWNQLLLALDKTIGFPNKIRSSVKRRWQGYDMWKNEHVIWLEYRVKVHPGLNPAPRPPKYLHDLNSRPATPVKQAGLATIRELMDLESAHTVDSPPSQRSPKNGKQATEKSSPRPKSIQSKPSASPTRRGQRTRQ